MAKRKTTPKKQPEPVTEAQPEQPVINIQPAKPTDEANDLFAHMKRRREKGR